MLIQEIAREAKKAFDEKQIPEAGRQVIMNTGTLKKIEDPQNTEGFKIEINHDLAEQKLLFCYAISMEIDI